MSICFLSHHRRQRGNIYSPHPLEPTCGRSHRRRMDAWIVNACIVINWLKSRRRQDVSDKDIRYTSSCAVYYRLSKRQMGSLYSVYGFSFRCTVRFWSIDPVSELHDKSFMRCLSFSSNAWQFCDSKCVHHVVTHAHPISLSMKDADINILYLGVGQGMRRCTALQTSNWDDSCLGVLFIWYSTDRDNRAMQSLSYIKNTGFDVSFVCWLDL